VTWRGLPYFKSWTIHFNHHPQLVASRTMGDFEELLLSETFYRPHKSFLINLNYIKRFMKRDGGQIEMQKGYYLEVSRWKKDEILKMI
jgi:two-component system LytT family response regulator